LAIQKALEDIKDVSNVALQDFTRLWVTYDPGKRELRIRNTNNQVGVLLRLLSELVNYQLAIDSITVRRSAGSELSSVLVLDAETATANAVLRLLDGFKHIEFSPLDHEQTPQERQLTLSFDLLDQPFTFLEVVRVLSARQVNIEPTADLLTMSGD